MAVVCLFICASPAGAATYYVRQDGSDQCNGMTDAVTPSGSPHCAFRTIQKGVDAASAPGDRVVIHGGVYRESVILRVSGAAGAITTIEGYPGETAIIDPGETAFRAIGNSDWELVDAATGEYRSVGEHPGDEVHAHIDGVAGYENGRVRLVAYQDTRGEPGGGLPGLSMFRATTDAYVDAHTPFYIGPGVWLGMACSGGSSSGSPCESPADCPDQGICAPTNRIHIRLSKTADMRWAESRYGPVLLEENADPRNYSIIVSLADSTLRVRGSHLMLRNLTFNSSHKTVRLDSGAHHVTFDGVTIWAGSRSVSAEAAIDPPHDILITRSRMFSDSPYWIFWSDAKDPPYPAIAMKGTQIDLEDGAHDVEISYCHIRGGFDGIGTNTSEYNVSVHHSRIENFLDDAFEIEGTADIGRVSAYENYIANSLVAFAPGQDSQVVTGPILFYRNVVSLLREPPVNRAVGINSFNGGFRYGSEYAFKQHAPNTFYYNNTVVLLNSDHEGVALVPGDHNEQDNTYVANNIYVKVNGQVQGSYDTGPGQIVDHNLYWKLNSGDGEPLAGGRDTIAELTAETGLEPGGIGAIPKAGTDPEFATWGLTSDTEVAARWSLGPEQEVWSMGDFLLGSASPAIGASMMLPVHPVFGSLPDSRASQDLGAIPGSASALEWETFPFDQGWRGPVHAPDLVELQITDPPPVALVGGSFEISDTVSDRGPAASAATITGYYLSADQLPGGPDIPLGARAVPGLAVGATSTAASLLSTPMSTPPALYYLLACADDTDLIPESSETNNCRASASQVRLEVASGIGIAHRPDGFAIPGEPLVIASSLPLGSGDLVTWDVTACPASQYNLYYSARPPGERVYDGALCDIGISGSAILPIPDPGPDGLIWMVVVGREGSMEGGHGFDSLGTERPLSGIGHCGIQQTVSTTICQ